MSDSSSAHPSTTSSTKPRHQISKWSLSKLWGMAQKYPGGRWAFSQMLGRTAPYTGTIKPRVQTLELGLCVVTMRDRSYVRNHLKSVHAIALINLGEAVTGLCTMYAIDGRGRGIVKGLQIKYIKKARGMITGRCEYVPPTTPGVYEVQVPGTLYDTSGDVVAELTADWKLEVF